MTIRTRTLAVGGTRRVHMGGWKRQSYDARDENFRLQLHGSLLGIGSSVDLSSNCSPIEDQGELGSCTAHAVAGYIEYNEIMRLGKVAVPRVSELVTLGAVSYDPATGKITYSTTVTPPPPAPPTPAPTPAPAPVPLERMSRLLQYYGARKLEGTVSEDSGATIRDAVRAAAKFGCANEMLWPYDISRFAENPPVAAWTDAASHKVTSYHAIKDGDLQTMKSSLYLKQPVVFGFQVYDAFMSKAMDQDPRLCPPKPAESLQGGHAVLMVGYDDAKKMPDGSKGAVLVRNSWGTGWGEAGYFWMSYAYIQNTALASDFWVIVSAPI